MIKIYYLDPDFRKEPNRSKPFCIRCQKEIKNLATAVKVRMVTKKEWSEAWIDEQSIVKDDKSVLLVGPDCWKTITKNKREK